MKAHIYPGREIPADWNNPEVGGSGLLRPHSYFVPFPDLQACRQATTDNRRYLSPWIQMLNGHWDCHAYTDVLQLPENILAVRTGFSAKQIPETYPDIGVYGQAAGYDFPLVFPFLPAQQPVKMYRKKFRLPLRWSGLRKKLVLLAVVSAAHVYCNGKLAGYTEGSMLSSEIDLTNYLLDGDNELIVLIWSQSNSSYLEPPVTGLSAGIAGDIYLEAGSSVFLHDIKIRTIPDGEEGSWKLVADVTVFSCRISRESPRLRFGIWKDGLCLDETCWQVPLNAVAAGDEYNQPVQAIGKINISVPLQSIETWHSESPVLYDVFIGLEEKSGQDIMAVHQHVGFRKLENKDGRLLLGGRPLCLLGAVWNHAGKMPLPDMVHNLKLLRRHNLNCLYVRDFAPDPIFLELCDIFGVYVVYGLPLRIARELISSLINDKSMINIARSRIARTLHRDGNHPSIITWSSEILSPEFDTLSLLTDPLNELVSDRFINLRDFPDFSDSFSRQSQRPGFTDWADLLSYPEPTTGPGKCYGNWFAREDTNEPQMLDKAGRPARLLRELKYHLCPLHIRAIDAEAGGFMAENRQLFQAASCFRVSWVLTRNGEFTLSGELDNIREPAGQEQFVEIWYGDLKFSDGAYYVLRFEILQSSSKIWAGPGYEVGMQEFILGRKETAITPMANERIGRLRLENDRHHIILSGPRFWMVFNRLNGSLESWRSGDKEILASPVLFPPGLAPAVSAADKHDFPETETRAGKTGILQSYIRSMQQACDGQTALIEFVAEIGCRSRLPELQCICRYEVDSRGCLRLYSGLTRKTQDSVRSDFDLSFVLDKSFQKINWAGKGPEPGLRGLHLAGKTGIYRENARDLPVGKTGPGVYNDCIWLNITDNNGFGIGIRADSRFDFVLRPILTRKLAGNDDLPNLSVTCRTQDQNGDDPARLLFELRPIIQ